MGDASQLPSSNDLFTRRRTDSSDAPKFAFARPSSSSATRAPDRRPSLEHDDPLLAGPSSMRTRSTSWRPTGWPAALPPGSSHRPPVTPSATLSPTSLGSLSLAAIPTSMPSLPAPTRSHPARERDSEDALARSDVPSPPTARNYSPEQQEWLRSHEEERRAIAKRHELELANFQARQRTAWDMLGQRSAANSSPLTPSLWSRPDTGSSFALQLRPRDSLHIPKPDSTTPSVIGPPTSIPSPLIPRSVLQSPSATPSLKSSSPLSSAQTQSPVSRGETLKSGLPAAPNRSPWTMWVGNIPSNAKQEELEEFFSARTGDRESGVESVHLMGHSNCAFVNYHLERHLKFAINACNGVPLRPEDKRSKPLLCRIRQREDDAKSGVGAQRGGGIHRRYVKDKLAQELQDKDVGNSNTTIQAAKGPETETGSNGSSSSSFFEDHFPKRYFVLKAHSLDDLKESVKTNLWRTQAHNENTLNQAYRTAKEGVFIIFSANKSGEWFGYAKLTSLVGSGTADSQEDNALGPPFHIEWIRVKRVPFGKTRHLFNSFNSNREVKISRDGTELEPEVGERLLQVF